MAERSGKRQQKKKTVVAVSGGFDPLHVGHVRLLQSAKRLGDTLVVILNGDSWLRRKKGAVFMTARERAEIIRALSCVDAVHIHNSRRQDVCGALEKIRPDIFANGGDRNKAADIPEARTCEKLGITMAFGVGKGGKVQSSSALLERYCAHVERRKKTIRKRT